MPYPITPESRDPYVLHRHRPKVLKPGEEPELLDPTAPAKGPHPVFKIRGLTNVQQAAAKDLTTYDEIAQVVKVNRGQTVREICRAGLVGWEHVVHKDKKSGTVTPIEFAFQDKQLMVLGKRINPPQEECLDALEWDVCEELSAAIQDAGRITIDEGKG